MNYVYIAHSGVPKQKWGIRRYQNYDGSLTPLGRIHYGVGKAKEAIGIKSDDEIDRKVMARGKKEEAAKSAQRKAKAAEKIAARQAKAEAKKAEEEAKEAEAKRKAAEAEAEAKKKESESKNNSKSESEEKKETVDNSSKARMAAKSLNEMTDNELTSLATRIATEKRVKEFTYKPSTGEKIKKLLKDTASEAAKSAGEYALKYATSRVLDAVFSGSGGEAQAKDVLGDKFYKKNYGKKKSETSEKSDTQTKTTPTLTQEKIKERDKQVKSDKTIAESYGTLVRSLRAMDTPFSEIANRLGISESTAKYVYNK